MTEPLTFCKCSCGCTQPKDFHSDEKCGDCLMGAHANLSEHERELNKETWLAAIGYSHYSSSDDSDDFDFEIPD